MRWITLSGLAATGTILAGSFSVPVSRAAEDVAALAKALPEATAPLQQGLAASEKEGKPISGKYEIEDGTLQLSVYTTKGGKSTEIIVDHRSGAIKKTESITRGEDLNDAKEQNEAMGPAKTSLSDATARAASANPGYIVVRVVPTLKNSHPVAEIGLFKGESLKEVEQNLD